MRLFEIFQEDPLDVQDQIKGTLLDILTPMVASHVPFVTLDAIIEKMADFRMGVAIDKNLIMTLLNPDEVNLIDRIEGDEIYLNLGIPNERALAQDDVEKDKAHVSKMAGDQAAKAMKQ